MKLEQLHEAKHIGHGSFDSLMMNYFTKHEDDEFLWIWNPKPDTFPWFTENDLRGPSHSVDEEILFIGQGNPNEVGISKNDVWIEYNSQPPNGDWMPKDHALKHIIIRDEIGKKVYP